MKRNKNTSGIMKATLGRLPLYLDFLKSQVAGKSANVSSTVIAKSLNLGEVQVRKDLNSVSGKGKPKTGYVTQELVDRLEEVLGAKEPAQAVIVGAGKLGKALLDYGKFTQFGVEIVAAFDADEKLCAEVHGKRVMPMSEFGAFVGERGIKIGIITVPKSAAQSVCDFMVGCGIKAIWNFAPQSLTVPKDVVLRQENLALSLAFLNLQLKNSEV